MNRTKIVDFLSNKNIWDNYKIYQSTQWYTKEEMRTFQLNKFKNLIQHCFNNVTHYRNFMLKINLKPEHVTSFEILKEFPVLTKEIIKENYDQFVPKNIKWLKGIKTSQTGGTTGNILYKRTDSKVRSSSWATYKRFYDWMGVSENDKVLRLMGGHVVKYSFKDDIKGKVNDLITNTKSLNPYDKSDKNIEKIIQAMKSNDYKLLKGYSQNLFFLANLLKSKGLRFNIPAITTTAEPLMEEHRRAFKEVFNSESYDQYGCGEIGGIAYECSHHKGLHVAEERVILEFNESNDLIITDLDNYAMPYIRYWNADQAIVSKNECSCGRKSLVLEKIMGRTCDYLTCQDGKQLHWAYLWHLLFDTNIATKRKMKKFQIVQKSLNDIVFRIVSDPLTEEDKEILTNTLKKNLGNIKIQFVQEADIENSASGKYRPVINQTI